MMKEGCALVLAPNLSFDLIRQGKATVDLELSKRVSEKSRACWPHS